MQLEEMTSAEVDALDRETPVILPFAAIEQHGPHLPTGTDSLIVEGILRRLDQRDSAAALAFPVERYGSSPHHMPFRGTATLASRTFLDVVRELAECAIAHGFQNIALLNGHGGNRAHLDVAVQEIRMGGGRAVVPDPTGRPLRVVHATYWTIAREAFAALRESSTGGMGHAGEMETSALLALRPELVRTDRLAPGGEPPRSRFDPRDMLEPGSVGQFRFFDEWTRTGALGDPRTATAEKGERFLDAAVDALVELLGELRAGRVG